MAKGTIRYIHPVKNFGFITRWENGERQDGDAYFHANDVPHDWEFDERLREIQVTFDLEESSRGPRARNVRAAQ